VEVRPRLHLEVNNTHRALLASELVARHEHLLALIERRRRKAA
jgi:hypothetical protein